MAFVCAVCVSSQIINSYANQYFYARYLACAMASSTICYLQDDDWLVPPLTALYRNYLRAPQLLHTTTNAYVHYLAWVWTYSNAEIDLHTQFNWLGTGAMVSRTRVQQFIQVAGRMLKADELIFADMYFSTWQNTIPYQLVVPLHELTREYGFSNGPDGIQRNKEYIWRGVKQLAQVLQAEKEQTLFPASSSQTICGGARRPVPLFRRRLPVSLVATRVSAHWRRRAHTCF